MKIIVTNIVAIALTGCALAPNTVRIQAEHDSHVSQHFGSNRTNMGAELIGVVAHWQTRSGWFLNVEEAANLSPGDGHRCNGGLCGPREVFEAQAGFEFQVRP